MEKLREKLKPNSMFSRVMVLFTVVILVSIGLLSLIFYVTMRSDRVESRLKELKTQGEEMAYLAAKRYEYGIKSQSSALLVFGKAAEIAGGTVDEYMNWKTANLMSDLGAYVIIVDRFGKSELSVNLKEDENAQAKIEAFGALLPEIQNGQSVTKQVNIDGTSQGRAFVVAVPWMDGSSFGGAVFIYTSAQEIRATYRSLTLQILAVALWAFVLAIISAYIFTRQMTKPLASMAKATESMAKGNFEQKAEIEGSEEIQKLAISFNTMAEQLERLEKSRREFVANVSHELRSPLTSIHGFIKGMQDGTIPQEEHPKYLQIVSEETTRLTKLINELLQLSRMEQEKTPIHESCFDMNELIRRVLIRRYNDIDQKEIEVEVEFEEEYCICVGDSDAIEQVMVNLIDNAIKFTPENGTIWLGTKTIESKKPKALIWVKDDGQEISQKDLPHIFDRFYKVDKAHTPGHGTGLGLSISKRIIEDHGQKIWAQSASGETGFYFTLEREQRK